MTKNRTRYIGSFLSFGILFAGGASPLHATYIYKNGKLFDEKYMATDTCEYHFDEGLKALKNKNFLAAEDQFKIVIQSFPDSSYAFDALYYMGVVKFERAELDIANRYFNQYLSHQGIPDHYEDVFRYKLAVATRLAHGERRHMFGKEAMPKWMTGYQIALDIFNDIIKTIPYQELAAEALIEKGDLLTRREEYPQAIDCYQEVIRKFPKTAFAMRAFQEISNCYLQQIHREPQNSDALALANINIRESKKMFAKMEQADKLEKEALSMREDYAQALYETGQLYERMKEPKSACLYYLAVIERYPATNVSSTSYQRLRSLKNYADELGLKIPTQR